MTDAIDRSEALSGGAQTEKFSFEREDREHNPSFRNISKFFRGEETTHGLKRKNVFAAGTAPMRDVSEMKTLLYLTDFDELTCLDPAYTDRESLDTDIDSLKNLADNDLRVEEDTDNQGRAITVVHFQSEKKERQVAFLAANATAGENMPGEFNIFVAGRRSSNPEGVEETEDAPASIQEGMPEITNHLTSTGYVVPDIDLTDDTGYFLQTLENLGLQEVPNIREKVMIMKENFPKLTDVTHRELLRVFRSDRFNPELKQQESVESLIRRLQTGRDEPEDTQPELLKDILTGLQIGEDIDERVRFSMEGVLIDGTVFNYAFESAQEEDEQYHQDREIVETAKTVAMKEAQEEHELAGVGLYKKTSTETTIG